MARRKHREGESLHKVLGVPALFSTAYGNVGSSIYYALGVVAAWAMGLTPVVFTLTGLLFVTTAWSYAEATAMLPEAGGSSSFTRRAFNEFVSFAAGWALMLDYIVTIAISAFFVPNYLAVFWPILKTWPYNTIGGVAVIVVLVVINVVGIKEAARLNIVLAVADLGTQVLIMIIGVVLLLAPRLLIEQVQLWTAPTLRQFVYAISIGTIAYTGIETISNMSEEAANPDRDVPRAINMVLVTVIVVYIGMSLVSLSAMPVGSNEFRVDPRTGYVVQVEVKPGKIEGTYVLAANPGTTAYLPTETSGGKTLMPASATTKPTGEVYSRAGVQYTRLYGTQLGSNFIEDPVQGVVRFIPDSLAWLRGILGVWVGILAATILVIATNAGLIGVSRLAYSLGQHRQVPPILGRVHPKRLTPYVAIIVFGVVACLIILPGSTFFLADLYAFGAMISFTAAHVSVVVLRFKEPELRRPFRTPLSIPVRGKSLPLLSVIGGIGTFTVWCVVVATHAEGRLIGLSWMAVGIIVYVLYRRAKGYSLTKTVEKVVVPPSMQADIDYDQILVPITGTRISDEMMVLACQLATEKNSSINGLYVIEVPLNLPLDARLVNERAKADKVLKAGALIASQFKVMFTPNVVTARQAGRAIVEEAERVRSEVIMLGTTRKRRIGNLTFGRTTDFVLDHSPCEVLLNLVPKDYPTEGSSVADSLQQRATPVSVREGDGGSSGTSARD
ncbi:MAG TPA: universal stress protein [Thermoleophilia bacterium]|nr:universal stress protein [Thermoleophilia bacterium]